MPKVEELTIKILIVSEGRKINCAAIGLPAAPHFALHHAYLGNDEWSDTGWKVSHIASGHSLGREVYGRKGLKAARAIAAVLERMPVDWNREDITYGDFAKLPEDIRNWARDTNAHYAR